MRRQNDRFRQFLVALAACALFGAGGAAADQCILDDLIVDGSACIGFDCVCGEVFGFDTLRLKENNLRIKFDDTSVVPGFPNNDWQLTANDSASGGANKFSIDDISNARTPFTIEARAPSHSLYVDDGGRVGLGTSVPSVELHVVDGNSPTLRLQQDGSGGFDPQTWDLVGNETNFFVRDVTMGSRLPFRIQPGASTNSIFIDSAGEVGVGTSSPSAALHVRRTSASETAQLFVEDTGGTGGATVMRLVNNGITRWDIERSDTGQVWRFSNQGNFNIVDVGDAAIEFQLSTAGDLTLTGNVITAGCPAGCGPDYVFEPDYGLMPLAELERFIAANRHLPNVPPAAEMESEGINMSRLQLRLLEKIEELTLYTLAQEKRLDAVHRDNDSLRARLEALERSVTGGAGR